MINYGKLVKDFIDENKVTAEQLENTLVDVAYETFRQQLPSGIEVTKRRFLKHMRLMLNIDTKSMHKFLDTGSYGTQTIFVKAIKGKTLKDLGYVSKVFEDRVEFAHAVQGKIVICKDGRYGTAGWITPELNQAIQMEVKKYGKKNVKQ